MFSTAAWVWTAQLPAWSGHPDIIGMLPLTYLSDRRLMAGWHMGDTTSSPHGDSEKWNRSVHILQPRYSREKSGFRLALFAGQRSQMTRIIMAPVPTATMALRPFPYLDKQGRTGQVFIDIPGQTGVGGS
jgi:hypothetical protein